MLAGDLLGEEGGGDAREGEAFVLHAAAQHADEGEGGLAAAEAEAVVGADELGGEGADAFELLGGGLGGLRHGALNGTRGRGRRWDTNPPPGIMSVSMMR